MAYFEILGNNIGARIVRSNNLSNDLVFLLWDAPQLAENSTDNNPIDINNPLYDHPNVQFLCKVFSENLNTKPHASFPTYDAPSNDNPYKKKYAISAGKRFADYMQFYGYTTDKALFTHGNKSYASGIHLGNWGMNRNASYSRTFFPNNSLFRSYSSYSDSGLLLTSPDSDTLDPGPTGPNGEMSDKIKYKDNDQFRCEQATLISVNNVRTLILPKANIKGRPKIGMIIEEVELVNGVWQEKINSNFIRKQNVNNQTRGARISGITLPTTGNSIECTLNVEPLATINPTTTGQNFVVRGKMETRYYNVGYTKCVTSLLKNINNNFYSFEEYAALSDDTVLSQGDYMRFVLLTLARECDSRGLCYPAFFAQDWEQQGPQLMYGDNIGSALVQKNFMTPASGSAYTDNNTNEQNMYGGTNNDVLRINTDSFSLLDLISCNKQINIHHTVMRRKVGQDTVAYQTTNNNTTNFYFETALKPIESDVVDDRFNDKDTGVIYTEIDKDGQWQPQTWETVFNEITSVSLNAAPSWDSATRYNANDSVEYNAKFYKSLQNDNQNKQPDTQREWWVVMANQSQQLLSPFRGWFTHINRDFRRKFSAYSDRMNDHVMNQVCYQHVREIMPGCIVGNYNNLSPVDGNEEYFFVNDTRNTYARTPHESMTLVHKYKPYLRADFQQPVCYSGTSIQGFTGTRDSIGQAAFYVNTTNANLVGGSSRTNFTPNGAIRACVKYANKIVIGGEFTNTYPYLAQLDLTTGQWTSVGGGVNGIVRSLYVDDPIYNTWSSTQTYAINDIVRFNNVNYISLQAANLNRNPPSQPLWWRVYETLLIGGDFTTAGGITFNRITSWNGTAFSGFKSGVNGTVRTITRLGNFLYFGGDFDTADSDATPSVPASKIVRYNTDSQTFKACGSGLNHRCHTLTVYDNKIIAGGEFTIAGGITANRVASYNPATESWSAIGKGVSRSIGGSLIVQETNNLYLFGEFTNAGDKLTNRIARINVATDNIEKNVITNAEFTSFGTGINGIVQTGLVHNNILFIGGEFTTCNNINTNRIAKYENNTWSPILKSINGTKINIITADNQNIYFGGDFVTTRNSNDVVTVPAIINNSNSNIAANAIAVYNLSTNTWGTLGRGFTVPANAYVTKIQVNADYLYISGNFTQCTNGTTTPTNVVASRFARYNKSTNQFEGMQQQITVDNVTANYIMGFNDVVEDFIQVGNNIYAVGRFTQITRQQVGTTTVVDHQPASRVANITNLTTFSQNSTRNFDARIKNILYVNQKLFVIGDFAALNGFIARQLLGTNTWLSLGDGIDSNVTCFASFGTSICFGGNFQNAGGKKVNYIAIWHDPNETWSSLGQGLDGVPNSVIFRNNFLYVTGNFSQATNIDGSVVAANGIVRYNVWTNTWESIGDGCLPVVYASTSYKYPTKFETPTEHNQQPPWTVEKAMRLRVSLENRLIIGGEFVNADEMQVNNVCSWDGTKWQGVGNSAREEIGANKTVYAFTTLENSDLILGGAFTSGEVLKEGSATDVDYAITKPTEVYAHRIAHFHRNISHFSGLPHNWQISKNYSSTDQSLAFRGFPEGEIYCMCFYKEGSDSQAIYAAGNYTRAFTRLVTTQPQAGPSVAASISDPQYRDAFYMVRIRIEPMVTTAVGANDAVFIQTLRTTSITSERHSIYRYTGANVIYQSPFDPFTTTFQTYYDAQPYGATLRDIYLSMNKRRVRALTDAAKNPKYIIPYTEPPYAEGNTFPINSAYNVNYQDLMELWKYWYDLGLRTFFLFNPLVANNRPQKPAKSLDVIRTSNIDNVSLTRSGWILRSIEELKSYALSKDRKFRRR